jgi:hypothetical protein
VLPPRASTTLVQGTLDPRALRGAVHLKQNWVPDSRISYFHHQTGTTLHDAVIGDFLELHRIGPHVHTKATGLAERGPSPRSAGVRLTRVIQVRRIAPGRSGCARG